MIKKLKRNCPICNNSEGKVLHNQEFILDNNNPLPLEYDVVCCTQCAFVYADVDANQDDYNEYYKNFSKYESLEISSGAGNSQLDEERLQKMAMDIISTIDNKNSHILDIGSGLGGLLKILESNAYKNLYALEPSNNCVTYINENSQITAFQGSVLDDLVTIFNGKKFDYIILSHVLEHIYDLNDAIKNIKDILNLNGKIYIEVPDSNKYKDFFIVPYYYFDIEHINHFNSFSLNSLLSKYGLEAIKTDTKIMKVSQTINYPAFYSLFQFNNMSRISIEEYINISNSMDMNVLLNHLVSSNKECVVWGAGNYTKRLLTQTILCNCNIKYFVDKDINKQGTFLDNIEIKDSSELSLFRGTIIIASALFSNNIFEEIKMLDCQNEIVILR